jgi:hypothetical protein
MGALVCSCIRGPPQDGSAWPIHGWRGAATAYANGDFLFNATGRNLLFLTPEQAAATGLPQLFVTSGPIGVLFGADGSVEVQRLGNHLQDICAALTG